LIGCPEEERGKPECSRQCRPPDQTNAFDVGKAFGDGRTLRRVHPFGSPATVTFAGVRPVALRPRLSSGFALSRMTKGVVIRALTLRLAPGDCHQSWQNRLPTNCRLQLLTWQMFGTVARRNLGKTWWHRRRRRKKIRASISGGPVCQTYFWVPSIPSAAWMLELFPPRNSKSQHQRASRLAEGTLVEHGVADHHALGG
jgi:hypothetical protein